MAVFHDLTQRLIPNLDRHLALPLIDFLDSISLYPHKELLQAKYDLLKETNMVTYVVELHREVNGGSESDPAPPHLSEKESQVMAKLETLRGEAEMIMAVISNPDVVAALRQDKAQNLSYLEKEHNVTLSQIDVLYRYGQLQYTIGNYGGAADYLYHFRVLSTDNDMVLSSFWGKLASDILEGSFDSALDELHKLKDQLDQKAMYGNPLITLRQRTWWLHWSLFVYFNHAKGPDHLVDHWLGQGYLNTLQTSSPYLLRYLVVALVISKYAGAGAIRSLSSLRSNREVVKEVIRAVTQEQHHYSDPITEFLRLLYSEVDFDGARSSFQQAQEVFSQDFFLSSSTHQTLPEEGAQEEEEEVEFKSLEEQWTESCRIMISDAHCRIHDRIDMADLADRLGLSREEGEKWIVRLVRDARLEAKIDFKANTVQMNHVKSSVHQTVIERTKRLIGATNEQALKLQAIADAAAGNQGGGGGDSPADQGLTKGMSGKSGNAKGGSGGGRGNNNSNNKVRGRSTIAETED